MPVGLSVILPFVLLADEIEYPHPQPVEQCLQVASVRSRVRVMKFKNPYYLRGDFDGDQRPDYAVAVQGVVTGRNGVLVCAGNGKATLLGADEPKQPPFSDMPDDNFVAPHWEVFTKRGVRELARYRTNVPHPVPSPRGESIAMIREDGISLIYWDGRRFRWAVASNP